MIQLRKANITDLKTLEYWDEQEHVMESDPSDGWNWAVELAIYPEWREQLMAEISGKPIGCIQIIDPAKEESKYWGEIEENKRAIDIWIGEKENLGKGYGTEMMNKALEICFANTEVDEVLIDPLESNKKAIRFYKKIGFEFKERRVFSGDNCAVYSISRNKWQNQRNIAPIII